MRIPENVISDISDKLSIVDVVSEYTSLKPKGDKFWGCCPFHNEKTPSFTVTEGKNMFYCFGCQKGGSIFNFIMEIEHMSFVDSVQYLGKKAGVPIRFEGVRENEEVSLKRESLLSLYDKCCGSFEYILHNSDSGKSPLQYLLGRGLSIDIIKEFRLGYIPNSSRWLYDFLTKKNYSSDFLNESGFFSKRKQGVSIFFDRVMFPVLNHNSQVVAFSGRGMSDFGPKYINSPETLIYHKGSTLFGINLAIKEIRKTKSFVLCEGNVDVMALHQAGVRNAVAPLGTAFTPDQARLLKRYADNGIIIFDGDNAGIKATEKACVILENIGIVPSVVSLSEGEDPGDLLKKKGAEALKNICKYTINSFDYLLEKLLDQFGSESPESKERVAKGMLPYINSIVSDIRKEACLNNLAEKLKVSKEAIFKELLSNKPRSYTKKVQKTEVIDIYNDKELYLMGALAVNCEYYQQVKDFVEEFNLTSNYAINVYSAISDSLKEGNYSLESIVRRIEGDELRTLITSKCTSSEFDDNPGSIIVDSLLFLKRKYFLNTIKNIENEIVNASNRNDIVAISELLKQKSELDEKLGRIEG